MFSCCSWQPPTKFLSIFDETMGLAKQWLFDLCIVYASMFGVCMPIMRRCENVFVWFYNIVMFEHILDENYGNYERMHTTIVLAQQLYLALAGGCAIIIAKRVRYAMETNFIGKRKLKRNKMLVSVRIVNCVDIRYVWLWHACKRINCKQKCLNRSHFIFCSLLKPHQHFFFILL